MRWTLETLLTHSHVQFILPVICACLARVHISDFVVLRVEKQGRWTDGVVVEQVWMRQVNFGRVSCKDRQVRLNGRFHQPTNEGIFGGCVGNTVRNPVENPPGCRALVRGFFPSPTRTCLALPLSWERGYKNSLQLKSHGLPQAYVCFRQILACSTLWWLLVPLF